MMRLRRFLPALLLVLPGSFLPSFGLAAESQPEVWQDRLLRVSFEEIDMPDDGERLGLYGLGAYQRFNSWLYGGISAYGAATGERGGFFTGGFALGADWRLPANWSFDVGGYIGAGGGGAAAQGGGLMLRTHAGLKYHFDWGAVGLNYTYVDFPNGDISSDAIAVSFDIPFSAPVRRWSAADETAASFFGEGLSEISRHRSHLSARVRAYVPNSDSRSTAGQSLDDTLGVVGVEYAWFLDDHWFATFETAGAFSGDIGGYAELLAGLGYRAPLTSNDRWALLPALTIGGAGGGTVDTGGGFVARANLGLEYRVTPGVSIMLDGGYLTAPDGNFDTPYVGLNFAYVMESFAQDRRGRSLKETDRVTTTNWRLRVVNQWYFDAQRKDGSSRDMQLLGAKLDWVGGGWWYLTGQGISAYDGDAGGYSEGHWGAGIFSKLGDRWQIYAEMLVGAGGGGGVDSGNALLFKPSAGIEYDLNQDFAILAGGGQIISDSGNLDATFADINLVWRFGVAR